jgi:hypothetical protein
MEIPLFAISRNAGANLSALQYHAVKLNGSGQVIAIAAVTDIPVGILQDTPAAAGRAAEVMVAGVSEAVAGAAVAAGAQVCVDNTGRLVTCVAGTDTTKYAVGQCLIGCDNANERITVMFNCMAPGRAA